MEKSPCSICPKYIRDCPGYIFSYGDFCYCQGQIIYVLRHREEISQFSLPERNIKLEKNRNFGNASFERLSSIIADIDIRLKETSLEGRLLEAELNSKNQRDGDMPELSDDAKLALDYISGWKVKRTPFPQWKAQRNYRGRQQ